MSENALKRGSKDELRKAIDRVDRVRILSYSIGIGIILYLVYWAYLVFNGVAVDVWLWRVDDFLFGHDWNILEAILIGLGTMFLLTRFRRVTLMSTDKHGEETRIIRHIDRRDDCVYFICGQKLVYKAPWDLVSKSKFSPHYTIVTLSGCEYCRSKDDDYGEVLELKTEFELEKEARLRSELKYKDKTIARLQAENLRLMSKLKEEDQEEEEVDDRVPALDGTAA